MNQLCLESGVEVQSLQSPSGHSSRYTPPAVRDIYVRAAEAANELLVSTLRERSLSAVGFIGENLALKGPAQNGDSCGCERTRTRDPR